MDVLAHGLWTYAIYYRQKYKIFAALFGIMPDIVAFGFFVIHN